MKQITLTDKQMLNHIYILKLYGSRFFQHIVGFDEPVFYAGFSCLHFLMLYMYSHTYNFLILTSTSFEIKTLLTL